MAGKLDKIGADLEKARAKRNEWDAKVKDLEQKYREAENTMIHEMVHAANLPATSAAQTAHCPDYNTPRHDSQPSATSRPPQPATRPPPAGGYRCSSWPPSPRGWRRP